MQGGGETVLRRTPVVHGEYRAGRAPGQLGADAVMGVEAAHHITAAVEVHQHRPGVVRLHLRQVKAHSECGAVAAAGTQLAPFHAFRPGPEQAGGSLLEFLAGSPGFQGVQRLAAGKPALLHQVEESGEFRVQ
ncbi:hypothetical protein D9M70_628720 [compost metagenome]